MNATAELLLLIGGGIAIWLGLCLALMLLSMLVCGAFYQCAWSTDKGGLLGLAIYVAAWIFLPVFMLVVSVIGGFFVSAND